jgi:hypothetical protein
MPDPVEVALLDVFNSSRALVRAPDDATYTVADVLRAAGLDASWSKQIVGARDGLATKKFVTLADLGRIPTIGPALAARFSVTSFDALRDLLGWTDHPALLLPVRIETRFITTQLLVRIYPDRPSITSHEPRLTRAELEAGRAFATTSARRDAWRQLAARFGPRRAAWIVGEAKRFGTTTPPASALREDTSGTRTVPTLTCLPDRFVLFLYRGDQLVREVPGNPITGSLPLIADPAAGAASLFEGAAAWVADFAKAESVGMGIRVSQLTAQELSDGFSKVIVVGLRSGGAAAGMQALSVLVDHHHYTDGIGFVPWGTPTNNTRGSQSGHSQSTEDREASFDLEITGATPWVATTTPRTNAQRLGHAFGMGTAPSSMRSFEHANDSGDAFARELQTALWPATGDYPLRYLMPGLVTPANLTRLAQHFAQFVRARGPLPTIRFGTEPYGVLPASRVLAWSESLSDNSNDVEATAFDRGLRTALIGLQARWLSLALDQDRVPKVNTTQDADKELLQILSMSPSSLAYHVRPFMDEGFISWLLMALRDYVFGTGTPYAQLSTTPFHWVKQWSAAWTELRNEQSRWWQQWTGAPEAAMAATPLMHLTGWWLARDMETDAQVPLVERNVDGLADGPAQYLGALCGDRATQSATLLCDMLNRSLGLADASPFNRATVKSAICTLTTAPAADVDRLFRDSLDLCTNRLDAWITSLATKRLAAMRRAKPSGLLLGAFGFTENLKQRTAPSSAGFVHAPSRPQAAAAAVLHNAYLTHANGSEANPFRINLNSERVARASRILDGLRQGQPLGALLGYQFESELHERQQDRFIDQFRAAFPLVAAKEAAPAPDESVEAMAARNVVDGLALARWWDDPDRTDIAAGDGNARDFARTVRFRTAAEHNVLRQEIKRIQNTIDAVSDVLMYEGVYHAVQGNYERGGAALEASSGQLYPPELESIRTPVPGKTLQHRVCLLMRSAAVTATNGPRAQLEPRVAAWATDILGNPADIGCRYKIPGGFAGTVTLADLGLDCIDLLYLSGSPLKGEETEIEARIRYFVRARHQLAADQRVRIDASRVPDLTFGLEEALELARQALDTLGAGTPLRPDSLAPVADGVRAIFRNQDVVALDQRIAVALSALCQTIVALGGPAIRGANGASLCPGAIVATTRDRRLDALMKASRWGVSAAIPPAPSDPDLDTRCADAVRVLSDRAAACGRLRQEAFDTGGAASSVNRRVQGLLKAAAALFGNAITVLPTFVMPDGAFVSALDRPGLLPAPLDEHRVRLWLQQVALVHEPVGLLDDLMIMADAWRQPTARAAVPAMRLRVAQLPSVENERWLALDDGERGEALHAKINTGRSRLSIVIATNDLSATVPTSLAGVLLDQWDERIPSNTLDTSVAFQYDAPGSQAPHTLLLAVPGTRDVALWSPSNLAEIVRDTMDLAKIRAVDADALGERDTDPVNEPGTGAVLPALLLPADPSRPGWARTTFANTIEEWVAALTFRPSESADFARYFAGQGWGMLFDEMGFRVASLAGGTPLVRHQIPGGQAEYPSSGIEFTWNASPRGEAIVFTLSGVGAEWSTRPRPVLTAYDASGAVVATVSGPWAQMYPFISFAYPLPRARRVRIVGGRDASGQMQWPIYSISLHAVIWP